MLRDSFIRYLIVAVGFMIFMAVSLGRAEVPSPQNMKDYDCVNPDNEKQCLS